MNLLALLGPLGVPEILFIVLIIVLIFGARRLPDIGRGLGEGIRNFRGSMREMKDEYSDEKDSKTSSNKSESS